MTRKGGPHGPPEGRKEEEPWEDHGTEESIQRTLDLILEIELSDENDEEPDFIYGDIVHDTEAEEPIALVVVNVPGLVAMEWELGDGETLADRNPKCPDDDDVIVVVRLGLLEDHIPDWDIREAAIPLEELVQDDVPFAPFPSLRLVRVKDSHLRE